MYSHTCCADYNLVQDYTLCCIAYTEWYYTKGVNCQIFTQKGINFLRSFWKNLHRTEKIYTGTACGACDKYEVCVYIVDHSLQYMMWDRLQNCIVCIAWYYGTIVLCSTIAQSGG